MITDLWIENFKGIGKRQHIPLRPVTLLIRANSAGTSTMLHALLCLRDVLRNHSFDPKLPLDGTPNTEPVSSSSVTFWKFRRSLNMETWLKSQGSLEVRNGW